MPGAPTTTAESRIGIDLRRISFIRPLAGEYACNFSKVAALYAGDPQLPAAWQEAIARTQQYPRRRRDIGDVIHAQQKRRGAPPEAIAASALLQDDRTVAIVTGQQAGAFGGPLYTLLKAITTIQLAERVAREHRVSVVPVFWVEAEDHDWIEVRSTTVLDPQLARREMPLPDPAGAGELPVAALTLSDAVAGTIDQLAATMAATDFTPWLESTLRASYASGQGLGTAFARLIDALLGRYGLVVFESSDPAAKPFVADLFARELQFPGRTAALASAAAEEMRQLGHEPQVVPQPDTIALFKIDGPRRAIKRDGAAFTAGDDRFPVAALVAEAVDHPERFSPNVLLRPVVQDALFPTICYVAGPSELAYLGQLRGVYEHFGVPMPLIYPRGTATLVDAAAARFLTKYNVPFGDLQAQDESALNRLLQAQLPKEVEDAIAEAGQQLTRVMQRIIEVIPAVDPTLAGAAQTTLGRMEHDLRNLHGKVIQAAKKRDDTLRRQFTRAQAQIFPGGAPQERTLGVAFFLNRYGPALVDRLLQELPLEMGQHWIITI